MLGYVRVYAQLRLGSELGVDLHDLQLGVNACGIVSCTLRRTLANMGTDMEPPVPTSVFNLANTDLVGACGGVMGL